MMYRFSPPNPRCRFVFAALIVLCALALAGCASGRDASVDPIFSAVPGQHYGCDSRQADERGALAKGATGTLGQAAIGGAAGGLIGHQFGSHSGQDIATGVGVAAGAAAGAWNAQRMRGHRVDNCRQSRSIRDAGAPSGRGIDSYHYQGG